jgi:hypothetical protein
MMQNARAVSTVRLGAPEVNQLDKTQAARGNTPAGDGLAGPAFQRFVDLVTLLSIHIYGDLSERVLTQLQDKAQLLGGASVVVHSHHAGFSRFLT